MLKDLHWTAQYELTCHKTIWANNEISLAKCLNFKHYEEFSDVVIDLTITNKVSVIEFIKEAFQRVWNHPAEESFKNQLIAEIDSRYDHMYSLFVDKVLSRLPYQEKLFQHQKDALFSCCKKRHNLIAFEQGLGKTAIAGSISRMLNLRRTALITPAHLKHTWLRELTGPLTQFNELYFTLLDASKSRTIKAFQERFVICNFDSLEKWMDHMLSMPFDHIIVDECTAIKNTGTNRYKMVKQIIDHNPDARITLLSGTPVRNRINDLFAYLKAVGHPLGENYAAFLREYTVSSKGRGNAVRVTGAKNTEQLWRQTSNFMLRKRKEECLDLPAKIYGRLYFDLEDYKEEYDKAVRDALEKSGKTSLNSSVHSINIVTSKAKLKGVLDFAESIIEQDEKVVIFTNYTEIIETMATHFGDRCVMINGSVNSLERADRVDRFMKDDKCKVFLGNVLAAGTGLTLTVASNMIFCDFPFSPADLVQAEDRIHRIGQNKPVNIHYAVADGSIDDHLYNLIHEKAIDASRVVDGKSIEIHSSENIQDMLISKLREQYNIPANAQTEIEQDQQESC